MKVIMIEYCQLFKRGRIWDIMRFVVTIYHWWYHTEQPKVVCANVTMSFSSLLTG